MLESLDSDTETRTISPMYIIDQSSKFKTIDKFASVLGITQDTIRIVSIYEGSTVVYFGVTASSSTSSSDTTKQLAQVNDQFNYQLQIIQVFSIIKFNHM